MPIILRGGTAVTAPPTLVLAAGEPAAERDTGQVKIGDGVTPWPALPYVGGVAAAALDGRLDVFEALGPLATDAELAAETVARVAEDAARVTTATLTTDGDILTRVGGVPARITRADLATDLGAGGLATDADLAAEAAARVGAAPLRDTLANLATTNPVPAVGRLVIATDSTPRMFAIGDGATAWLALPKYEETAAPQRAAITTQTVTATNVIADRAGLAVTFTVGSVPWIVEAREPYLYANIGTALPFLFIRDAANVNKAQAMGNVGAAAPTFFYGAITSAVEYISVPGTYTRKVSVQNFTGAGTNAITWGANSAMYVASITARPER